MEQLRSGAEAVAGVSECLHCMRKKVELVDIVIENGDLHGLWSSGKGDRTSLPYEGTILLW